MMRKRKQKKDSKKKPMAIDFAAEKEADDNQEVVKVTKTDKKAEKNIFGVQSKKIKIPDPLPEKTHKYTLDEHIPLDKVSMIDEREFKPNYTLNIDEMKSKKILKFLDENVQSLAKSMEKTSDIDSNDKKQTINVPGLFKIDVEPSYLKKKKIDYETKDFGDLMIQEGVNI